MTSVKGALGESGASGSAACVAALLCGRAGRVPPISGLATPDAAARPRCGLQPRAVDAPGPIALVNSFASGGASVQRRAARRRLRSKLDNSSTDLFLHGRVAIVTGGSRGIGRGIAELLVERGAAVGIAYREREEAAREFEASVRAAGGRAWAGQCDVADEKSVAAFFEQAVLELGPVDILVNNAGVSRDAHIALLGLPQWQQVMQVNLDGVYHCVRAVVRGMLLRRWGRIINVSSPSARMPLRWPERVRRIQGGARRPDARVVARPRGQGRARQRRLPGLIDTEMLDTMPAAGARGAPAGGRRRPHRHAARSGRAGGVSRVRGVELCHRAGHRG